MVALLTKIAESTQLPSNVSCYPVSRMPPDATARIKSDSRLSSRQATIGSVVEEALAAVVAIETESTQLPKMFDSAEARGIKQDSTTRDTDLPSSPVRRV